MEGQELLMDPELGQGDSPSKALTLNLPKLLLGISLITRLQATVVLLWQPIIECKSLCSGSSATMNTVKAFPLATNNYVYGYSPDSFFFYLTIFLKVTCELAESEKSTCKGVFLSQAWRVL